MSAHMVSDATITALVDVAVHGPAPDGWDAFGGHLDPRLADEFGEQLITANVASLEARYPDDYERLIRDPAASYEYQPDEPLKTRRRPTAVEALKLIAYWRYQSCEDPGWEKTQAAEVVAGLETRLIQNLPGYHEAPWGWDG